MDRRDLVRSSTQRSWADDVVTSVDESGSPVKRTNMFPSYLVSYIVCQSNVSWYTVLSGFPSYITIQKVAYFIRVHFWAKYYLAFVLFLTFEGTQVTITANSSLDKNLSRQQLDTLLLWKFIVSIGIFVDSHLISFINAIFQVIVYIYITKTLANINQNFQSLHYSNFILFHKIFLVPLLVTYESVLHSLNLIAFISFHTVHFKYYTLCPFTNSNCISTSHYPHFSLHRVLYFHVFVVTFSLKSCFNSLTFIYCVV